MRFHDDASAGSHVQWGSELTWPDGQVEVDSGAFIDRALAEGRVAHYNNPDPEKGARSTATARLVRRTVEIGEWEPYPPASE